MRKLSLNRRENKYPPELAVTKALVSLLNSAGHVAIHFPNTPYFIRGFPDLIIFTRNGGVRLVELKTPDGSLTGHQTIFFQLLRAKTGHPVYLMTIAETGSAGISPAARMLFHQLTPILEGGSDDGN